MLIDVYQRYKKQENVNKKMLFLGYYNFLINKLKEIEIVEILDKDFKRLFGKEIIGFEENIDR